MYSQGAITFESLHESFIPHGSVDHHSRLNSSSDILSQLQLVVHACAHGEICRYGMRLRVSLGPTTNSRPEQCAKPVNGGNIHACSLKRWAYRSLPWGTLLILLFGKHVSRPICADHHFEQLSASLLRQRMSDLSHRFSFFKSIELPACFSITH